MRAKAFALVALLAALAIYVDPTSAFEATGVTRPVGAEVVADTNAYDDITIAGCAARKLIAVTCTWGTVVNEGTTDLVYKLTRVSVPSSVTQWCVGGNCVTSGTAVSGTIAVGSSASLSLSVNSCPLCTNQVTTWQLDGEKANILNSMHSGLPMTITWTT